MTQDSVPIVVNAPSLHDVVLEVLSECARSRDVIFRPSEFMAAVSALKSDLEKLGVKITIDHTPLGPYCGAALSALDKVMPYYLESLTSQPWRISPPREMKFSQESGRRHRERNGWTLSNKVRKKMAENFAKTLAQARKA